MPINEQALSILAILKDQTPDERRETLRTVTGVLNADTALPGILDTVLSTPVPDPELEPAATTNGSRLTEAGRRRLRKAMRERWAAARERGINPITKRRLARR